MFCSSRPDVLDFFFSSFFLDHTLLEKCHRVATWKIFINCLECPGVQVFSCFKPRPKGVVGKTQSNTDFKKKQEFASKKPGLCCGMIH